MKDHDMRPVAIALACLGAALGAASCAGGSSSREGPPGATAGGMALNPAGLMLAGCDVDYDYRIAPAELDACIVRAFAAADRDGGGTVSLIELGDWRAQAFGHREALPGPFGFDASQDGSVSADEFAAAIRMAADAYADADGAIPFSALSRPFDRIRPLQGEMDLRRVIQPR